MFPLFTSISPLMAGGSAGTFILVVLIAATAVAVLLGTAHLVTEWGLDSPRDVPLEVCARLLPSISRSASSLRRRFFRALVGQVLITISGERVAFEHLVIRISSDDVRKLVANGDMWRLADDAVKGYAAHARRNGWEVQGDLTVTVQVDPALRSGWIPRAHAVHASVPVEGFTATLTYDEYQAGSKIQGPGDNANTTSQGKAKAPSGPSRTRLAVTKVSSSSSKSSDSSTGGPLLVLADGTRSTYRLTREGVAGRGGSCDIVLTDEVVSGRHLRLYPSDGSWWVVDLGSTNGTMLNRDPITSDLAHELRKGATITLGNGGPTLEVLRVEMNGKYTSPSPVSR